MVSATVSSPQPMELHCFTPRLSQACSLPVSAQLRLSLVAPYCSKSWQAVPLKYLIHREIPRRKFRTFQCHTGCCCSRQGSVNTPQPWHCVPHEAPSLLSSPCHTTPRQVASRWDAGRRGALKTAANSGIVRVKQTCCAEAGCAWKAPLPLRLGRASPPNWKVSRCLCLPPSLAHDGREPRCMRSSPCTRAHL